MTVLECESWRMWPMHTIGDYLPLQLFTLIRRCRKVSQTFKGGKICMHVTNACFHFTLVGPQKVEKGPIRASTICAFASRWSEKTSSWSSEPNCDRICRRSSRFNWSNRPYKSFEEICFFFELINVKWKSDRCDTDTMLFASASPRSWLLSMQYVAVCCALCSVDSTTLYGVQIADTYKTASLSLCS